MYELVRTSEEIDGLLNQCSEGFDNGSRYPGMTYEDGIRDAIRWLTDTDEPGPLD